MENPWVDLPTSEPYVLQSDRNWVSRQAGNAAFTFATIPEPFLGDARNATVVLLNLNPGDDPSDLVAHSSPQFREVVIRNLRHEAMEYPFYGIDPRFAWTGCVKWWTRILRELFNVARLDRKVVAQKLAVIEWFPYHAKKSKRVPRSPECASQQYSFELARTALGDKKLVVGMRARPRWSAVDSSYAAIPYLKNWQNPTLSRGNMTTSLWDSIVDALR